MEVTVVVLNETTSSSQAYSSYITFWDIQLPGLEINIGDVSHLNGQLEHIHPNGMLWRVVSCRILLLFDNRWLWLATRQPQRSSKQRPPCQLWQRCQLPRHHGAAMPGGVLCHSAGFFFWVPNWVAERHVFFSFGSIHAVSVRNLHPWSVIHPDTFDCFEYQSCSSSDQQQYANKQNTSIEIQSYPVQTLKNRLVLSCSIWATHTRLGTFLRRPWTKWRLISF